MLISEPVKIYEHVIVATFLSWTSLLQSCLMLGMNEVISGADPGFFKGGGITFVRGRGDYSLSDHQNM